MDIDVNLIEYDAFLITETGASYALNNALLSLQWEEQENTLAQRATLNIANANIGSGTLMSVIKLNCIIRIYGKWGAGRSLLFEGFIWDWQYSCSSTQDELIISAYDPLIRLQQSKDFKYFSAGLSTPTIIGEICANLNIPLDYKWGRSITHSKKVFSGNAISDMIFELLNEVRRQTGEPYAVLYRGGKMEITGYGTNSDIYRFTKNNTFSTTDKLTLSNLVTRVKIIGKADDDGRSPVEATVDGDLAFGVLQDILRRDEDKDIATAKADAAVTLNERGKPGRQTTVNAPDLPFLRRGDVVEMSAGNLIGRYRVIGVSHNATNKTMTMTLAG